MSADLGRWPGAESARQPARTVSPPASLAGRVLAVLCGMPPAELRGVQLYISDNGGVHLHLHRHSAGEAEQLAAALGLGRVPDSAVPLDDEQDAGWAVEWSALSYCFGGVTLTCYTDVLPGAAAEGGGPR